MQVTVVSLFLTGVGMTQFKIVTAGGGRDSSRPCSLIISWVSWIPGLNTSGDQRDHNLRLSPRGFTEYAGHRLRVFQPERAPRTIRSRASSRVKDFGCQRPQACCASGNSMQKNPILDLVLDVSSQQTPVSLGVLFRHSGEKMFNQLVDPRVVAHDPPRADTVVKPQQPLDDFRVAGYHHKCLTTIARLVLVTRPAFDSKNPGFGQPNSRLVASALWPADKRQMAPLRCGVYGEIPTPYLAIDYPLFVLAQTSGRSLHRWRLSNSNRLPGNTRTCCQAAT